MASWTDLEELTRDRNNWDIHKVDGIWTDGVLLSHIFIMVPKNTLQPILERFRLREKDVDFGLYFFSNGPVMSDDVIRFAKEWNSIWGDNPPELFIEDAPHPDFKQPSPLQWPPELIEKFSGFNISKSTYAPLWGQKSSYFGDFVMELNSGPQTIVDDKVKYNQDWVERKFACPFCMIGNLSYIYSYELGEPEMSYYDPHRTLLPLFCPKCDRCVDVIMRESVTG